MRKPIIGGNWKMYKTFDEAVDFVEAIQEAIPSEEKVDTVICAPKTILANISCSSRRYGFGNWCTEHAF